MNEGSVYNASPIVNPGVFNGVLFVDPGYSEGDNCWGVSYFEGKSTVISFVKVGKAPMQNVAITQIELRPAPTMTFLNPRPASSSLPYPWSWDGGEHNHYIKLPLALTYEELSQGSQIVVSGITEKIDVVEGVIEENKEIHFRAGGLLIASVVKYNGERDLVQIIVMEEFTGEILAVNFCKAYKNLPQKPSLDGGTEGIVSYRDMGNIIARCTLNGVVMSEVTNYIPSNGLLGNLVFQSQYIQNYGGVIEAYYWTSGRYLYILRLDDGYNMKAINMENTESPLQFPIL